MSATSVFPIRTSPAGPSTRISPRRSFVSQRFNVVKPVLPETHGRVVTPFNVDEPTGDWPTGPVKTPNAFLRMALFGCHTFRGESKPLPKLGDDDIAVERELGPTVERRIRGDGRYEVIYTGQRLNQDDSEVWQLAVLTAQQAGRMGEPVQINLNEWCGILHRRKNNAWSNAAIRSSLLRLLGGTLVLTFTKTGQVLQVEHLLESYVEYPPDGSSKKPRTFIAISRSLLPLFQSDGTLIDLQRKAKLKTPLAKWLHDFYSSHSETIEMPIKRLWNWSGSTHVEMRNFRIQVRKAIGELLTGDDPLLADGTTFKDDVLVVVKASNSPVTRPESRMLPATAALTKTETADGEEDEEVDRRSLAEKAAAKQRSKVAL